jgi:hypothetical protein
MGKKLYTIIRPIGHQKARLLKNTGLNEYTVNSRLEAMTADTPLGIIDLWCFRYCDIREPAVKAHILKETIGKRGLTEAEALEYLNRVPNAIPQDQVEIEVIE